MTATSRIKTLVQAHPEISTDYDSTDLDNLIETAKEFIAETCNLPIFPDLLQGYSQSNTTPSTDISGLTNNELSISVNGSEYSEIELTLASCTSGAAIATELQTQIRAVTDEYFGFDEITVAYDGSSGLYTITSGRYGEASRVYIAFNETTKDVAENLKLSPAYGGIEKSGSAKDDHLERICARLVEAFIAQRGLEGISSFGKKEISASFEALDSKILSAIHSKRRMWAV